MCRFKLTFGCTIIIDSLGDVYFPHALSVLSQEAFIYLSLLSVCIHTDELVLTHMSVSHRLYRMNSHDDDEEAARERRRRARQERLRNMENDESSNSTTETNR